MFQKASVWRSGARSHFKIPGGSDQTPDTFSKTLEVQTRPPGTFFSKSLEVWTRPPGVYMSIHF